MLKISLNSPVPIYEQLVGEIKRLIENGDLAPGESLPTIRGLASQLDVAINTVARAYMELESSGYIESNGRKGSFVKKHLPVSPDDDSKAFKEQIRKLLQKGMNREQIENIFGDNLSLFFD
ncbi:GntR family transcriptional regulator [candidate division KSB1 bacterium]